MTELGEMPDGVTPPLGVLTRAMPVFRFVRFGPAMVARGLSGVQAAGSGTHGRGPIGPALRHHSRYALSSALLTADDP